MGHQPTTGDRRQGAAVPIKESLEPHERVLVSSLIALASDVADLGPQAAQAGMDAYTDTVCVGHMKPLYWPI